MLYIQVRREISRSGFGEKGRGRTLAGHAALFRRFSPAKGDAFTVVDNRAKTHLLESPICAGCLSLTLRIPVRTIAVYYFYSAA